MCNRLFLLISLIVLSFYNISFKWPLNNGKLTSTFGESRWDHFHDGIDMISVDKRIFPIDSGNLLFFWDRQIFPFENYPGAGNYKIIKHSEDIYSVYMHLADGVSLKRIYTRDDPIAIIGNSGRSFADHLHFSILDKKRINRNITLLIEY